MISELVRSADAACGRIDVAGVFQAVCRQRPQLWTLAEILEARPDLLTPGRPAGSREIERLIRALREAGAEQLVLPRCGEPPLTGLSDGARICSACSNRRLWRANPCVICGGRRSGRRPASAAVPPACGSHQPAHHRAHYRPRRQAHSEARARARREPPLDGLIRQLVEQRNGRAATVPLEEPKWLFHGVYPGQPIHPNSLMEIASELPAVVISRLLGFHQSTGDK
ncbi:hypothetical protein [Streptomyces sp. NPDC006267]|uniref:hypothetical protein n=1 Tax=Streptomyces sp. NPDC006267 TaxID=3157173 RepID=UPI0033A37150